VSPAVALTSKIPSLCTGDGMVLAGAEGGRAIRISKAQQVRGPAGGSSDAEVRFGRKYCEC
jgi:hypothetical protein